MPRPLSVWMSPIEFGVAVTIGLWLGTMYLTWQNNQLLRQLCGKLDWVLDRI